MLVMGNMSDIAQYILGVFNKDSDMEKNLKYCIDCEHLKIGEQNPYCEGCKNNYPLKDSRHDSYPLLYSGIGFSTCDMDVGNVKVIQSLASREHEESQKLKRDAGKLRLSLVPTKMLKAVAEIREYGCAKYGSRDSWMRVSKDRYRDAAYRHFISYIENPEGLDKESGLPTLWHLACNICFLCELEEYEKEQDWE